MKTIPIFIFLLILQFVKGQEIDKSQIEVIYLKKAVYDTIRNRSYEDNLSLQIGTSYSLCFSNTWRKIKPKIQGLIIHDIIPSQIPNGKSGSRTMVLNNYKTGKTEVFEPIKSDNYSYQLSNTNLSWKFFDEIKTVLGYNCHKASVEYRGRIWTAWYTDEIPVSEGPYIFKGLPGLILEVYDSQNYFNFLAVGLEKKEVPIEFSDKGFEKVTQEKIETMNKNLQNAFVAESKMSLMNLMTKGNNLPPSVIENFKSQMEYNPLEKPKKTTNKEKKSTK